MKLDPFALGAFVISLAVAAAFVVFVLRVNEWQEQHERDHVEGIHRIQNEAARQWAMNLIDDGRR